MRRVSVKTAILVVLVCGFSLGAADDIEIQVRQQTRKVNSRKHDGQEYFRLSDIGRILDLRLQLRGSTLLATGSRGTLELTEGRPLARFQNHYIMLDLPVWARNDDDWYVSEDFLSKAVPLLIDDRLERTGRGRYRLGDLQQNDVRVEVINYPDHVSIVFLPSRKSQVRVRDFQRQITVEFDDYRVRPQLPAVEPDSKFVAGLRFDPASVYGGFEIRKGPLYKSYREYRLSDPDRLVVGFYGQPADTEAPPSTEPTPVPIVVDRPAAPPDDIAPVFNPSGLRNIITIDAGHGGENYGVHPTQELLEKNFTLRLAGKLEEKLKGSRFRPALTRTRDLNLSAELRSAFGNRNRSRAFVSIHFGGAPSESLGGPVVYVHRYMVEPHGGGRLVPWTEGQRRYLDQSRELASRLQAGLNRLFGKENQVAEVPLAVLEPVTAPAVLIEAGFLTNPEDLARIGDPEFQDRIAETVVNALMEFLQ